MKSAEEIQTKFTELNGIPVENEQGEPEIEYQCWLEVELILASEREAKWRELCEKQKELRQVIDYKFAQIGYSPSHMNVELRQRIAELEKELL